ncbi:uncharacterized protein [Symphalangus syndactylus]|uniref:uncharacterized protein n=1 Tax=Symphalangus syndactylus TaxID=9590 RepID=UPI003006E25F
MGMRPVAHQPPPASGYVALCKVSREPARAGLPPQAPAPRRAPARSPWRRAAAQSNSHPEPRTAAGRGGRGRQQSLGAGREKRPCIRGSKLRCGLIQQLNTIAENQDSPCMFAVPPSSCDPKMLLAASKAASFMIRLQQEKALHQHPSRMLMLHPDGPSWGRVSTSKQSPARRIECADWVPWAPSSSPEAPVDSVSLDCEDP